MQIDGFKTLIDLFKMALKENSQKYNANIKYKVFKTIHNLSCSSFFITLLRLQLYYRNIFLLSNHVNNRFIFITIKDKYLAINFSIYFMIYQALKNYLITYQSSISQFISFHLKILFSFQVSLKNSQIWINLKDYLRLNRILYYIWFIIYMYILQFFLKYENLMQSSY